MLKMEFMCWLVKCTLDLPQSIQAARAHQAPLLRHSPRTSSSASVSRISIDSTCSLEAVEWLTDKLMEEPLIMEAYQGII